MATVITHPSTPWSTPTGFRIKASFCPAYAELLSMEALHFIRALHLRFNPHRQTLLFERNNIQQKIDGGWNPGFCPDTAVIRNTDWRIPAVPDDIKDRRVEITGPVERKMIINAMNSGANVFMADFEDSNSPGWNNVMSGQINLRDAINGTIGYTNPENGKKILIE